MSFENPQPAVEKKPAEEVKEEEESDIEELIEENGS